MMLKSLCLSSALLGLRANALPSLSTPTPSSPVQDACAEIAAALPADRVPNQYALAFTSEMQDYWSTSLRTLKPTCMILPHDASEVAVAVKILNKYPDVRFAVKSGGHDPNPGHATAKDGVLISTAMMKGATYDKSTGLAHVKPAGQWNDVIGDLAKDGVTMLGGRLGIVGVAGLLMGGGLSFLSAQHGMAADSIVEWELVTADGTVRRVKASEEPELAVALRGSGSQFGIVTEFVVQAYDRPPVWGGSRTFSGKERIAEVLAAVQDFTVENKEDPKAAIIPATLQFAPGDPLGLELVTMFIFYDGPAPPTDGPLAKILALKHDIDTCKQQSYADLLKANGAPLVIDQSRQQFRTYTLPHLPDVPDMLQQIMDQLSELLKPVLINPLRLSARCGVAFQPLPAIVAAQSNARGGNAMGIKDDLDRIVLEFDCGGWQLPEDDAVFANVTRSLVAWIDEKLDKEWTKNGKSEYYLPYFINDAAWDQDVFKTYRDYDKFKALQQQNDPEGFFSGRGGGFKY